MIARVLTHLGLSMEAGEALPAPPLGAFAAATGIVALDSLHAALADVLPPHRRKLIDANPLCLTAGAERVAPLPGDLQAWV